jgi:plastocyanin
MSIRAQVIALGGGILLIVNLVGCGGSPNAGQSSSSSTAVSSSAASASTTTSATNTAPSGLTVDVTIKDGVPKPVNASYQATVGQPITFRVTSDAEDELHVHSEPEHSFEVKAASDQPFTFTVDVPGRVEVELHHLNVVLATIDVR